MQAYPPSKIFTAAAAAKSLQSCPTLRDPMDCSLPGSSVHGIFQARVLEWGAIAFSENIGRSDQKTSNLRGKKPHSGNSRRLSKNKQNF